MIDDTEIEVKSILVGNRHILERNFIAGKTKINASELKSQGFVFSHYTHEMKHQDRDQSFLFVYEYGIGKLNNDCYEIIFIPF